MKSLKKKYIPISEKLTNELLSSHQSLFNEYHKQLEDEKYPYHHFVLNQEKAKWLAVTVFDHFLSHEEARKELFGWHDLPYTEQHKLIEAERLNKLTAFMHDITLSQTIYFVKFGGRHFKQLKFSIAQSDDILKKYQIDLFTMYGASHLKKHRRKLFFPEWNAILCYYDDYILRFLFKPEKHVVQAISEMAKKHGLFVLVQD